MSLKPKRVYWRLAFVDQPDIRWISSLPEARRIRDAALDVGCRGPLRIFRITVYSARELREWERQREAEIRREEREKAQAERDEALAFLRRTATWLQRMTRGSMIVSSAVMTPTQIAVARAAGRMLVTPDGCGYVYVPETMSCDGEDEAK